MNRGGGARPCRSRGRYHSRPSRLDGPVPRPQERNMEFLARTRRHLRTSRHVLLALALAAACAPAAESPTPPGKPGEWMEFEGSWNGTRRPWTLRIAADHRNELHQRTQHI